MANFTLIRALGWSLKSKLLSSEMATLDARITKTINAAEGSSHTPTTQIVIAGSGADIAPLVSADFDGEVQSGKAIHWYSGSTLLVDAGTTATLRSTLTVDHTSSYLGIVSFTSAAILRLLSGAVLDDQGGAWSLAGTEIDANLSDSRVVVNLTNIGTGASAVNFYDSATLLISGTNTSTGGRLFVSTNGRFDMAASAIGSWSGTITEGGTINKTIGAWNLSNTTSIQLGGSSYIVVGGSSYLNMVSGSEITGTTEISATTTLSGDSTFVSGSSLTLDSGSTFNVDTDIVRTGADVPLGSGAVSGLRTRLTAPTGASVSVDCEVADTYVIPDDNGGVDVQASLATPSVPCDVTFYASPNFSSATPYNYRIAINGASSWTIRFLGADPGAASVTFRYTGTFWIVKSVVDPTGSRIDLTDVWT